MCDTAAEVLGFQRKNYKGQTIGNNPIIEQLSRIQKDYRIKIKNSSNIEEVKKLRNIRNQTLKRMKNEIRKNNEKEIEDIAKLIQNDNQSRSMFKAVKQIKNPSVENNIIVHNDKGETINKIVKYNTMKNYFKNKFWKEENERIKAFEGKQRPLKVPISKDEVEKAVRKLKNNKASGEERITGQLIKYASDIVTEKLCKT